MSTKPVKSLSLRPDLYRSQVAMDDALDGAVILDSFGNAWQKSGYLGLWYRAYDGDGRSSFEVAQRGPIELLIGVNHA